MKLKLFAAKSKKTGRWFQWHEYADDGYGKYEDSGLANFGPDDLPRFFSKYEVEHIGPVGLFKDHIPAEVEFVPFSLYED
jgi:hypothetical protein